MELKQMKYFKEVVDAGSISEAARILHMSQPPLSMSMKKLEEELDVKLFVRGSRRIQLTEAGALYYKRVNRILEMTDNTVLEVARSGKYRTFSLGLTPSTIPVASPALGDFVDKYEDVHFQIYDGSTFELMHLFDTHVIEAAFLRTPFAVGDFKEIPIRTEPMVAAIPKQLAKKAGIDKSRLITLKELSQFPLSIYRRYNQLIRDAFSNSGLNPNYFSICDDTRTSLLWAHNGKGVALFPQSLLTYDNEILLCPVDCQSLNTTILFVYKEEFMTECVSQFLPFVSRIVKK